MPKKIIIDTDPGVDDVLAILLALASPELDVIGITITFGNTHAVSAHGNLLKIYASLAREFEQNPSALSRYPGLAALREGRSGVKKTVLALGADAPIGGELSTAAYFHGADGLSNISTTHPHFTPPPLGDGEEHEYLDLSSRPASQVIIDLLKENEKDEVTIVALGPLSNLALAWQHDPDAFRRVKEVVWMGGALDVPGNTTPSAEFNCFADPYAAQEIMDAVARHAFPLTMAPLDITTPHTIHFDQLIHEESSGSAQSPLREFISAMLIRVRGLMASFGQDDAMEMHDPVAIWYALESGSLGDDAADDLKGKEAGWTVQRRVFKVERIGEYTRGMCVVDRRGTGEQSFLRTKGSASDGTSLNTNGASQSVPGAPRVIVSTPGKQALEEVLLGRVFGTSS